MTDNTLNGALEALGELMAENLEAKNVQANASDGLTTLANKILNIPPKMFVIVTGDSFKFGSYMEFTGRFNIDWGDGTIETNVLLNNRSHTYTDKLSSHIITVTGKITTFKQRGFYRRADLSSIVIPDSVTSLGYANFYDCSNLISVIIPNSVTSFGGYCFRGCSSLTSVTVPNSVTSFGEACFQYCSSLTSVTIPNSVTRLDSSCFWGCSNLTSITIPDSVTHVGDSCFYSSGVIDYELYWTGEDIITYKSTMMPNKTNTFFYIPIGTKTEYINKGYPANKLIERGYQLIVTGDKNIILSGETSTITAKLVNNEQPLSSESLSYIIKHDETTIDSGTVTTDSNGEVEITYTGTGVGEVNITIEYGTLLQETFVIKDCFAIDNATLLDHNDNIWSNPSSINRGDEYSTISITSGTRLEYMDLDLTQDRTIEFDINTDNANGQFCNFRQDTTNISGLTMQNLGLGADEFYHIKIEINGDSALVYNSTNSQTYTISLTGANRFNLRAYHNTIKFKNFIYY